MASSLAPVARPHFSSAICAPTLFACQPNFQLDGYGEWAAVRLVARYLQAVGDSPCYDCWE